MNNQNRVLSRTSARELTVEELQLIAAAGGPLCTQACTLSPAFMAGLTTTCDSECPTP